MNCTYSIYCTVANAGTEGIINYDSIYSITFTEKNGCTPSLASGETIGAIFSLQKDDLFGSSEQHLVYAFLASLDCTMMASQAVSKLSCCWC